ncbi:MAG: septum site-determining protein MinD [Clostridia bacterium]|nr:septum site-determining protein MinD [Clostridia bacterium]
MGSVMVVTSGKGGVGKSTVSSCLGAALCKLSKRVLLVDMDEGLRSLDLMLNVSAHTVFDVSDIINGYCNADQAVLPVASCPGLYLLPAPSKVGAIDSKEAMQLLCSKLAKAFDYVIIDSPAGIDRGFEFAVCAADNALVVVTPDPVSVRDGSHVAKLLRNSGVKNIRLVINKVNTKLMLEGVFYNIDEIIDATSVQLIAAIPTDDAILCSNALGEPLADSYAADAFDRLAARLENKHIPLINLKKIT